MSKQIGDGKMAGTRSNKKTDCNCITHFCCGYDAGREAEQRKHLTKPADFAILFTLDELEQMAQNQNKTRLDGHYEFTAFVPDWGMQQFATQMAEIILSLCTITGAQVEAIRILKSDSKNITIGLVEV